MSLIYTAKLDSRYAGRPLRIFAADGTEVAGSPFTLDAAGDYAYTASTEGHYVGKVDNPAVFAGDGVSVVDLELNEPASILAAAGGGVAADETAYFTCAASGLTDYAPVTLNVVADSDPADWWSLAGHTITLEEPCFLEYVIELGGDFDYGDAATVPDIYYTVHAVAPTLTYIAKVGQLLTPGSTASASGTQVGNISDSGSSSGVGIEGMAVTISGEAGTANGLDTGTANFSCRLAIRKVGPLPTFPA